MLLRTRRGIASGGPPNKTTPGNLDKRGELKLFSFPLQCFLLGISRSLGGRESTEQFLTVKEFDLESSSLDI